MIDEAQEELAALYSLGLLSDEETAQFEDQLHADVELREFVRELQDSAARLAYSVPAQLPPAAMRSRLLFKIQSQDAVLQPAPASFSWLPWTIAAAFAILASVLALDTARLRREVSTWRKASAEAQREIAVQHETAPPRAEDALSKLRIATLISQGAIAQGSIGIVAWDGTKQRGVLTLERLPPPGPAQDYQLWIIDPEYAKPVSGGLVHVDDNGNARLTFTVTVPIHAADKFAVSRERKGGVSTNQGPVVLLGQSTSAE